MRKISSIILVILFFNPSVHSQEFDMSKIQSDTEDIRNKEKPSGFVVSVGYGFFKGKTTFSYWDGSNYTQITQLTENDIRIHYLLNNNNLGFYISPIVSNHTKIEHRENGILLGPHTDFSLLGSLNYGFSYTFFKTLTLSSGTGISISSAEPSTNFEFGTMFWLGKKINFEYRIKWMDPEFAYSSKFISNMISIGYNFK